MIKFTWQRNLQHPQTITISSPEPYRIKWEHRVNKAGTGYTAILFTLAQDINELSDSCSAYSDMMNIIGSYWSHITELIPMFEYHILGGVVYVVEPPENSIKTRCPLCGERNYQDDCRGMRLFRCGQSIKIAVGEDGVFFNELKCSDKDAIKRHRL